MEISILTDVGQRRTNNQDYANQYTNKAGKPMVFLADGMGGHRAGEVASSMVVTHLGKRFSETSSVGSELDAVTWLREIIEEVNLNIIKYTEENIESKGMGTTCVAAIYTKEFILFANVGDSSGFVEKNGKLYKVTKDHTLVNILVETGELSLEEAKNHPKRNVLMRALGAAEKVDVDVFKVETTKNPIDGIFLCSDGLTNMLTKEQIEKVLTTEELTIDQKVAKLIKKSNSRGGNDNISVAYAVIKEGVSSDS